MPTMRRVYLPLDTDQLRTLRADRQIATDGLPAFSVTDDLRDQPGMDDDELCEYLVGQQAGLQALALDGLVVAAADVAADGVTDEGDHRVGLRNVLPLKRFASFHLIDLKAQEANPGADLELSWFDATELDLLLQVIEAG